MEIEAAKFTRRDYMQLPEGFPAELIDGGFVKEDPPTFWHQRIVVKVAARVDTLLGSERVIVAPTGVCVDEWNVLQPDLAILAPDDPARPDGRRLGVPVLVVEVLSPSTARRDRDVKTALYLRAGVSEVWLVNPDARTAEVHTREGAAHYHEGDGAVSRVVPEFRIDWRDFTPRT
jgi:Uma2 family endonuclease